MILQATKTIVFFILGAIILGSVSGCSGGSGSSDPIASQPPSEKTEFGNLDTLPVMAFDGETAIGLMGYTTSRFQTMGKVLNLYRREHRLQLGIHSLSAGWHISQ
jgi:hypothetical protein